MGSISYTINIDENDKKNAEQIFDKLGLNMSSAISIYIKTVVRLQEIPFKLSLNNYEQNSIYIDDNEIEDKLKSYNALKGLLHGEKIDLDKEREERILF